MVKNIIWNIIWKSGSMGKHFLAIRELKKYYEELGWFSSIVMKFPRDKKGHALPWYTYPAIEFLRNRLNRELRVFEYGCGGSTEFYSGYVKEVCSVESDSKWFKMMSSKLCEKNNVSIQLCSDHNAYIKASSSFGGEFDIIVIDAGDRVKCTEEALNHLSEKGVIIFDNSDRLEYEEAYIMLRNNGFRELEFYGYGPGNIYRWKTSVFYRNSNCLNI